MDVWLVILFILNIIVLNMKHCIYLYNEFISNEFIRYTIAIVRP